MILMATVQVGANLICRIFGCFWIRTLNQTEILAVSSALENRFYIMLNWELMDQILVCSKPYSTGCVICYLIDIKYQVLLTEFEHRYRN